MSRRSGARRHSRVQRSESPKLVPWRRLPNPYEPIRVLEEEQVEVIHQASLHILENLGIEFQNDEALDILNAAGAEVDRSSQNVRIDRGLIKECVDRAPAEFTLHARNPDRHIILGGNHINFAAVAGPPNVSDLDAGRRPGTYKDQCDLIRLEQCLTVLHLGAAAPVEGLDLPPESRHLDTYYAFITMTDRVWNGRGIGRERIADALKMLCIARGVSREQIAREPGILTVINVNSPRRVDREMLAGLTEMVRSGQPAIVTPFTLAGAMSPITLAGALAQQNAEALAVIAFTQMVRPGTPVVYGGFTSNVDMKSGAPAFGTPEYARAAIAGGQLARRYRLPYRSSNVNASNVVDAQAAYESEMSIWAAVMGHANLVYHGAGWKEGSRPPSRKWSSTPRCCR